jgi:hypothetical protein
MNEEKGLLTLLHRLEKAFWTTWFPGFAMQQTGMMPGYSYGKQQQRNWG